VKARNDARTLIYTTQKSLQQVGARLSKEEKDRYEEVLYRVEQICNSRELSEIIHAIRELREVSIKLARMIYTPGAAPVSNASAQGASEDDIVIGDSPGTRSRSGADGYGHDSILDE